MRLLRQLHNCYRFSEIVHLRGKPEFVKSDQVRLRGIHIKSEFDDNPNLIFFPEFFDQAENWLNFFMNPMHKILQYRNIYILYPRNFGNSDHTNEFDWQDTANDVARFMYQNKISTATFTGHGLGAKVALAAACYHYSRCTGYFSIDSSPMDQSYHESFHQLKRYLKYLDSVNLTRSYTSISQDLKNNIQCPKWRTLFLNNLTKNDNGFIWKCNYDIISKNLQTNQPSSLLNWVPTNGLYPGRACFVFPEYSRFVYLNTNTIPMQKVCPKLEGYRHDIFAIQGDQNPQNHWVYQLEDDINPYAQKMMQFIRDYDGVHILLKDRSEIGNFTLPNSRNRENLDVQQMYTGYTPAHYYHNWRFNDIYGIQNKQNNIK